MGFGREKRPRLPDCSGLFAAPWPHCPLVAADCQGSLGHRDWEQLVPLLPARSSPSRDPFLGSGLI